MINEEEHIRSLETKVAVLETRLENFEEDLKSLRGNIGKVIWIVLGGLLSSMASWVALKFLGGSTP